MKTFLNLYQERDVKMSSSILSIQTHLYRFEHLYIGIYRMEKNKTFGTNMEKKKHY